MKPHDWVEVEIDCGSVGSNSFWQCHACGLAGHHEVVLSLDCDIAKQQIIDFRSSPAFKKKVFDFQMHIALIVVQSLQKRGVGGAINRISGQFNGRKGHWRYFAQAMAPRYGFEIILERNRKREIISVGKDNEYSGYSELSSLLEKFFDELDRPRSDS